MDERRFIPARKLKQNETVSESFKKSILDNGIKIISDEVANVESFSLGISIDVGSADDPVGLSGLAHFLEHAVFRRTKNKTTRQIASSFESVGAYTNAFTTKELTCFYVRALKPHFVKSFNLLAELVLKPVFVQKEFETEKLVITEEIKSYEDDPEDLIFDSVESLIFKEHPYGMPITGTRESISRITLDDLANFHNKNYLSNNIVIASAGNLSHERLVSRASILFEKLPVRYLQDSKPIPVQKEKVINIENKPFTQAHLLLARQVPGLRSEERYPLAALSVLLGEGMSSRLYQQIREMRGLAYSVDSSLQMFADTGIFIIYAALEEKNVVKAEKLVEKELKKIIDKKISAAEINRAKQQLTSDLVMSMESMSNRMQSSIKSELIYGRQEKMAEKITALKNLSLDSIKECAEKYLDIKQWNKILYLPE